MFRCQNCGRVTFPHEPMTKKIVETKEVVHADRNTRGTQIVKEITICETCAAGLSAMEIWEKYHERFNQEE